MAEQDRDSLPRPSPRLSSRLAGDFDLGFLHLWAAKNCYTDPLARGEAVYRARKAGVPDGEISEELLADYARWALSRTMEE